MADTADILDPAESWSSGRLAEPSGVSVPAGLVSVSELAQVSALDPLDHISLYTMGLVGAPPVVTKYSN